MQFRPLRVAIANLADLLALCDQVAFLDEDTRLMRVSGQQPLTVSHDGEFTVAA